MSLIYVCDVSANTHDSDLTQLWLLWARAASHLKANKLHRTVVAFTTGAGSILGNGFNPEAISKHLSDVPSFRLCRFVFCSVGARVLTHG